MTTLVQTLINGLLVGSVYALLALGFSLIYRVTGVVNLAQGGFAILAAFITYTASQTLGFPLVLAVPAAVLLTAAFSAVLGAVIFVPSLSRLPEGSILIATAGMLTFIEGMALVVWGNSPYSLPQFIREAPIRLGPVTFVSQGFWIVGATVGVTLGLRLLLARSKVGAALRASADNAVAARLVGVDVPRMTLMSFVLAAAIAAVGGIVLAPITSFQYDTPSAVTISGFIAVAIGGLGSFGGAIAGGLVLGLLEQLTASYVSSLFSTAVALAVLAVVLTVRPQGLVGNPSRRREDVRFSQQLFPPTQRFGVPTVALFSLGLLAAFAAVPLLRPDEAILGTLTIAGILSLAVIGLDVLMGYTGQVSLGQSGFLAIGAYASALLTTRFGLGPGVAMLAGVAVSVACAIGLSLMTARLQGLYLALATLSFALIVDAVAVGWTDLTGGPSGVVGIRPFALGAFVLDTPESLYYFVLVLLGLAVAALYGGVRGPFGRALHAVRTDRMAAAALGVDSARYRATAFALSAALASVAGGLYAHYFQFLSPDMVDTSRSFELVTMLIVGGEATLVGPVLGALVLTTLPTIYGALADYKVLMLGLVLMVVMRFLPGGLWPAITRPFRIRARQPGIATFPASASS